MSKRAAMLLGVATAGLWSASAVAFQIETSNPDLEVRWDNTVRYNVGWRVHKREQTIGDTWSLQASDYKFDKGDIVTNRLELLSEFDLVFKKNYGFRTSASAWYDAAYGDEVQGNPAYQAAGKGTTYPGNKFTSSVTRYYHQGGEVLDAFVFGRADLGDAPLDVRLGRHNIYWGESLFSTIHGVSYAQGPVNFRKALATPGAEAKELFLPLNQVSALLRLNDHVSFAAQYYLEWKPYRLMEGGTYLGVSDLLFSGGTNFLGTPFNGDVDSGPNAKPKNSGNWGLNAKVATGFGNFGAYYRKFDDKIPQTLSTGGPAPAYENAYAKGVKLWGASVSKTVAGVAVGAELAHRDNGVLNTQFGSLALARGDTWHALLNAVAFFGRTPLFDAASLSGELSYSRLDKIRSNPDNFKHVDYKCPSGIAGVPRGDAKDGCSTNDAWGIAFVFTPTWYQKFPGVDLTMPIAYNVGLKGNSPVPFGGSEGSGSFSIGVGADYQAKYKFDLAYTGYFGRVKAGPNSFATTPGIGPYQVATSSGNGAIRDRGWLSLTFKTTF